MEVGAISLVMNFPADEAEITGVFLGSNPEAQVMYNVKVMNSVLVGLQWKLLW